MREPLMGTCDQAEHFADALGEVVRERRRQVVEHEHGLQRRLGGLLCVHARRGEESRIGGAQRSDDTEVATRELQRRAAAERSRPLMEHNAFTQPFVQHVASDMPAVRDRGRGGDDDVLGERHGVEKGVHRSGRARLIGAIGHDDEQVNVAVGPRVPPCAGSEQDDPLRFEFVGDERDHPGHDRFEGCRSRHRPFRPSTDYTTTVARFAPPSSRARFPRLRPEHGAVLSAIGAFRAYEEVEPLAHVADLDGDPGLGPSPPK